MPSMRAVGMIVLSGSWRAPCLERACREPFGRCAEFIAARAFVNARKSAGLTWLARAARRY
jgi:hypothetical protein